MSRRILIVLAAALGVGLLARADPPGPTHMNLKHGFSFAPPEGALAMPPQGSGMLAKWVALDGEKKALAWTLTFYRARPEESAKAALTPADLPKYAKTLQDRLAEETQLAVDSAKVVTVAGKGAVDVVGSFALGRRGNVEFRQFRRQVWVLTGPAEFLVVKMEGPLRDGEKLSALCDGVLKGLTVMDAQELLKARQESLQRGNALLKELAGPAGTPRLHAAATSESEWFLIQLEGKPIGFKAQAEGKTHRKGTPGLEIRTWTMTHLSGAPAGVQTQTLFVADGLAGESWETLRRSGEGAKALVDSESGTLREGGKIACEIAHNGQAVTLHREIPAAVDEGPVSIPNVYLPHAVGEMLARLVDRSAPGVYAFATYDAQGDHMARRVFRVIGPARVAVGGTTVPAVEASDSASDDAQAVQLWLDEKGLILRLSAPGGLTMERTTRAAVFKAFPEAEAIVTGKN
ncbi:MAG: hypothetical protein NTV86_12375 [Planctomycetota bacterium]|nr:hypothetical protein [Planctomycetota bacterium]